MTREQAADLLDNLIGFIEDNHGSDYDEAFKLAIKALKQEPCEDCISRQAVLAPYESLNDNDTICIWLLRQNIKQQSPVTPKAKVGKWIPVSERLPETNVEVLVTTTEWGSITIAERYSANDYFIKEGATIAEEDEIVAWMPLPEPYKAESEESNGTL